MLVRNLLSAPPSNRVRHAGFGANGQAGNDLLSFAAHPNVDIVCVAEVDLARMNFLKEKLPDAKFRVYQDWRRLLDKDRKNLDSVNVSTPDHMHAPIAMSAMELGLPVYVQKPLAHEIHEVRQLTETARRKKLVTQMGIQIHSAAYYRIGVKVVQSGAIGKVKEVHAWSNKKWGDSTPLPNRCDPVPSTLDWDLWLGVCAARPYIGKVDKSAYYHPQNWRKRVDFGTGTFGDMGCHIYDPVFESLGLSAPISVRSEGPAPNCWNWAANAVIHYVFPGTRFTEGPTVAVTWYDGDERPPRDVQALLGQHKMPEQGSIFVGTKGAMLLPHIAVPVLFPEQAFKDYKLPHDRGTSHYKQFIDAVQGKAQTSAPFDYSGPLTEAVLLGGVASRFPRTTLQWNANALQFTNAPAANALLRRTYRQGWEVPGLG